MNAITDILNSGDNKRTFENTEYIDITRNTVKFGQSVYQFKNVTGFRVGEIPKNKFPLQAVLILTIGGILSIGFGIGWLLLLFAVTLIVLYFTQPQYYGLSLFLNSGQERFFLSKDKGFLMNIVSVIYDFMETDKEGSVHIDLSNRSVKVGGDFYGNASTGDKNTML